MRFLADIISLFRIATVIPILIFSLQENWLAALVWLALGWGSDLVDGLAARKFGSLKNRFPQFDADGLADSALAFASAIVPVVYTFTLGFTVGIVLAIVYLLSVVSAITMIMGIGGHRVIAINMIVFHGFLQVTAVIGWFAYMAAGPGLVVVEVGAILFVLYFQRHKVATWLHGRFA